jgi:hypothetical protein
MAGDWIKMRTNLDTDPAVVRISSGLKTDRFSVVGRLHKIWSWANEHLTDGQDVPIDSAFLDTLVEAPGFADQLRIVGWLSGRDGNLSFPSFLKHNGSSAKQRALDSHRKKTVRVVSGKCPDDNRTKSGPEKRREEFSVTERTGTDPPRLAKAIGMGTYGTFLAGKLPTRSASDVQFLTLIGRAVDERHIAESLVRPALDGCDAKGVRKPIGMFRAALEKNIKAAGGELDLILKTLNGGSDGSESDSEE